VLHCIICVSCWKTSSITKIFKKIQDKGKKPVDQKKSLEFFPAKSERILQGATNAEHRGRRGVGETIREKDFAMRDIDRIYPREDLRSSRPSSF